MQDNCYPPDGWLRDLLARSGARWQTPPQGPAIPGIPDESERDEQPTVTRCDICKRFVLNAVLCWRCAEMVADGVERFSVTPVDEDGLLTYEDMLVSKPARPGDYRADIQEILRAKGWR